MERNSVEYLRGGVDADEELAVTSRCTRDASTLLVRTAHRHQRVPVHLQENVAGESFVAGVAVQHVIPSLVAGAVAEHSVNVEHGTRQHNTAHVWKDGRVREVGRLIRTARDRPTVSHAC